MNEHLQRFTIDDWLLRWGEIPGSEDPNERRRALLLVIHGQGWRAMASPVYVRLGDFTVLVLEASMDQRELVCVVPDEIIDELNDGARIVVEQWGRVAEAKVPFTRDKLPPWPPRQRRKR